MRIGTFSRSGLALLLVSAAVAQADEPRTLADWSQAPLGDESGRVVSVDVLRNPISNKARQTLRQALRLMQAEKHSEAIQLLRDTLVKYPSAAGWVHSLLGFELLKTTQFAAAAASFEKAVELMPHDASNHQNFGIALAGIGDYPRAEEQARRALQLAPGDPQIRRFLDALAGLRHNPVPETAADQR